MDRGGRAIIKGIKIRCIVVIVLISLIFVFIPSMGSADAKKAIDLETLKRIEKHIQDKVKAGKVPGITVVITSGSDTVYQKSFGYASLEDKKPVNENTLFEIGSCSKAFTGLAVRLLEERGQLSLKNPVTKYIPWFRVNYKGKAVELTVANLLYHTTGIPFRTIGEIPATSAKNAIELTVRGLVGQELDFYPGKEYKYATLNYDVLGLIIEKVSGKSYEQFIEENILKPLNMNNTYMYRAEAYNRSEMAVGYKIGFMMPREYYAPTYRGNTPAGYIITDAEDLSKWLKAQTLSFEGNEELKNAIKKAHIPNRSVKPREQDGASYASGWDVYQKGEGELAHGGGNPNFSSYIVFEQEEELAVGILTNIGGVDRFGESIGMGIMDILQGREMEEIDSSMVARDNGAVAIFCVAVILFIATIYHFLRFFIEIIRKERHFSFGRDNIKDLFLNLGFVLFLGYCLYMIPTVMFNGLSWKALYVWAPYSMSVAAVAIFTAVAVFAVYYQIINCFPKKNETPYFFLFVFSCISGLGNTMVIFAINEALNRVNALKSGLLAYLALGILMYVIAQKLVRNRMVAISNETIYSKRMELIDRLLGTPFYLFEEVEENRIYATLNNDTETVSDMPAIIIDAITSGVTLICCFIYLGTINFYGLLLSIAIIALAAGLYFMEGKSANKLWERTRDIQNTFFQFITDLVKGFKELNTNRAKQRDFREDMEKSCNEYKEKSTLASVKFTNVFVVGELIFTIVIGAVAFVFPILFKNIHMNELKTYVFVYIYMTGPVRGLLNNIPRIFRVNVSWKRINNLVQEITLLNSEYENSLEKSDTSGEYSPGTLSILEKPSVLKLKDIEYKYKNSDNLFKIGPISLEFKSGEVTFITGGNGSGKTTLIKTITGLYKPSGGFIELDGKEVSQRELGEHFSNIFSDYYLFEKLYGINWEDKNDIVKKYLNVLQIDNKVTVENGRFSTTALSSGQRKRLALLVSYLDDKPICIFDELAADQDPEFKKYFYTTLLKEIKNQNKIVIAITHDDHYFHVADKVIKLDMGTVDNISYTQQAVV